MNATHRLPRRATLAAAAASAALLTLAGCGVIPPPPPGALPPTAIPSIEPTLTFDGTDTNDGFTPQEHTAVRLRVTDCEGWGNGSGFILNESQIITNRHVIEGATRIEVTTYDGRDFVATSSQIAPVADLAIVTLEPVFTDFVSLSDRTLTVGDPVQIVGYPEAQALETEEGYFQGTELDTVDNSGEYVEVFRAHTLPGNSGSAIFDEDGLVVSILYASDTEQASIGWGVKWLKELLDDPTLWEPNLAPC